MRKLGLVGVVLLFAACAGHSPDPVSAAAGPSVGAVKTADRVVRIIQSDAGMRYWVESADGVLLEADLTLSELTAYDADLGRLMDESVVETKRPLDASFYPMKSFRAAPEF